MGTWFFSFFPVVIAVWMEIEGGFTTIFFKYLYIDLLVEIISQVQGCVSRSKVLLETSLGHC